MPRRPLLLALCLAAAVAVAGIVWWVGREEGVQEPGGASRYLNMASHVGHVGVEVCAECHVGEHYSYKETPHSRAFQPVDASQEPLPGIVNHRKSGFRYEMYAQDGEMRIRESVLLPSGATPVLTDLPVHYVVGSGESSRTYVTRKDGFLLESPTTWFTRPRVWAMSPGYDEPIHRGFGRAVGRQCLGCHVGRIETLGGSDHRIAFREDAIGCERCHGPGEAHVAYHRKQTHEPGAPDPTIVVPTDLEPHLAEDICGQCHLDDTMVVSRPGRDIRDWRPGMPSEEFRIHYGLETPSRLMKVVGHMDQMKASRCYQESGKMTCLSCHDPHGRPQPADRAAHYRRRCLTCHEEESCALDGPHRRAQHADDSCIACHMPTVGTDIVHFAFTHHRVAIHEDEEQGPKEMPKTVVLVPKDDVSHIGDVEQERNLALAYLRFADRPTGDPENPALPKETFFDALGKGARHLQSAYERGARDPLVLVYLAHLRSLPSVPGQKRRRPGRDPAGALRYLEEAFRSSEPMSVATRLRGLELKAWGLMQMRMPAAARPILEELTKLRRSEDDWIRLHDVLRELGAKELAMHALEQAVAIGSSHAVMHRRAAEGFAAAGRTDKAELHRQVAEHLERIQRRR